MKILWSFVRMVVVVFLVGCATTGTSLSSDSGNDAVFAKVSVNTEDLYGLWSYSTDREDAFSTTISRLNPDHTGVSLLIAGDKKGTKFKIRQHFTWKFEEKTQTFTQRVTEIFITDSKQQKKRYTGNTTQSAKITALRVEGKISMIMLIEPDGHKVSYFKIDERKLAEEFMKMK